MKSIILEDSGFDQDHWFAAAWIELATKPAAGAVASPSRTEFAAIENDLQVQFVPGLSGEDGLQITLGLLDTVAV